MQSIWDLFGQFFVGLWSILSAIWQLIFGLLNFIFQLFADVTAWLGALLA